VTGSGTAHRTNSAQPGRRTRGQSIIDVFAAAHGKNKCDINYTRWQCHDAWRRMHRHACFTRPTCRGYPRLSLFVLAANLTLRGAPRMTRGKGGRGNRRPPPYAPVLALLSLASASGRTGPNRPAPVMTVMTAMTAMAATTVIDPPRPKACPRRRHALGHRSRRRPHSVAPKRGARAMH
jgi:hypothetical protein